MSKTTSPIEHTRPATDFETMQQEHIEQLKTELADKDRQLAEARADADHWKSECNTLQRMVHEVRAEIAERDKLIEQMREALEAIVKRFQPESHDAAGCMFKSCELCKAVAAIAAAKGEV